MHTLEVLAAHKASVDIVVGERHRTQLLKVKVQHSTVNGVQEWTAATQRMLYQCSTVWNHVHKMKFAVYLFRLLSITMQILYKCE